MANNTTGPRPPYKFDEIKQAAYLNAIADRGLNRGLAAKQVGISRQQVANFRRTHPEFAIAESEAEIVQNGLVENALYQSAVEKKNVVAQQVWLYNRNPERWRDRRNFDGIQTDALTLQVLVRRMVSKEPDKIEGLTDGHTDPAPPTNGSGKPIKIIDAPSFRTIDESDAKPSNGNGAGSGNGSGSPAGNGDGPHNPG